MTIVGAKGKIENIDDFILRVNSFANEHKVTVQVFDANLVFGKYHLVSALQHAKRSMERKTNTTNSLEMEIMLYASGERQLKLAIPKMGVKKGKSNVAFVFADELSDEVIEQFLDELSLVREDKVLEGDQDTLRKFGITDAEIETVSKDKYGQLILEKVAMVDVIK